MNIHALHTSEDPPIRFSPGGSVDWLWMPYQVMKNLWAGSPIPRATAPT